MEQRTIRNLIEKIVDCKGKKGKAEITLQQLHTNLQCDLEKASTPEERTATQHDLWFLEGYLETPSAKIADCLSTHHLIDRSPRKRRTAS